MTHSSPSRATHLIVRQNRNKRTPLFLVGSYSSSGTQIQRPSVVPCLSFESCPQQRTAANSNITALEQNILLIFDDVDVSVIYPRLGIYQDTIYSVIKNHIHSHWSFFCEEGE
jgi:hypothetical protein